MRHLLSTAWWIRIRQENWAAASGHSLEGDMLMLDGASVMFAAS